MSIPSPTKYIVRLMRRFTRKRAKSVTAPQTHPANNRQLRFQPIYIISDIALCIIGTWATIHFTVIQPNRELNNQKLEQLRLELEYELVRQNKCLKTAIKKDIGCYLELYADTHLTTELYLRPENSNLLNLTNTYMSYRPVLQMINRLLESPLPDNWITDTRLIELLTHYKDTEQMYLSGCELADRKFEAARHSIPAELHPMMDGNTMQRAQFCVQYPNFRRLLAQTYWDYYLNDAMYRLYEMRNLLIQILCEVESLQLKQDNDNASPFVPDENWMNEHGFKNNFSTFHDILDTQWKSICGDIRMGFRKNHLIINGTDEVANVIITDCMDHRKVYQQMQIPPGQVSKTDINVDKWYGEFDVLIHWRQNNETRIFKTQPNGYLILEDAITTILG